MNVEFAKHLVASGVFPRTVAGHGGDRIWREQTFDPAALYFSIHNRAEMDKSTN